MNLEQLEPGARLGGFVIVRRLGRGGMGVVYEARDEALGRTVALKVPSRRLLEQEVARARFEREARATAGVMHENVVVVHGVAAAGGWPFIVMEHVPGGTLADRLQRGALPWREACALLRQVALGLEAIHARGLVHRDLKPSNVLFDAAGRPKVADLGLVRQEGQGGLTTTGEFLGTPRYVAPEQIDLARSVDARADLYALGCMLHEALTGSAPFAGGGYDVLLRHMTASPPSIRERAPDVPPAVAELARALLAKDPAQRPASAAQVADALAGCLADAGARPRRRAPLALLGLAAAAIAAGAAALHLARGRAPDPPPATPTPPSPPATAAHAPPAAPPSPPAATAPPPPTAPADADPPPAAWTQRHLAALQASADGLSVRLTDARGGYRLAAPTGVYALVPAPGGLLLSAEGGGRLTLWDPTSGDELWSVRAHETAAFVAVSADGRRVATAGRGQVRLWDLTARVALDTYEGVDDPRSIVLSATGDVALVGDRRGRVLWLRLDGSGERRTLLGDGNHQQVALGPDGLRVAAAGRGGRLRAWHLDQGHEPFVDRLVAAGPRHTEDGGVFSLAWSDDGTTAFTGSFAGEVFAWDLRAEGPGRDLGRHRGAVTALALEPGGRRLITGDAHGQVRLVHVAAGTWSPLEPGETKRVLAATFVDEGLAATAGSMGTIRLWDLRTGRAVERRADHEVRALRVSDDGRRLAVVRADGGVELRAADGLRLEDRLAGEPTEEATDAAFAPDGRGLLLASEGRARLFRPGQDPPWLDLPGQGRCRRAAFDGDGRPWVSYPHLVTWDLADPGAWPPLAAKRVVIAAEGVDVAALALAPAGDVALVLRADGTTQVHRLQGGALSAPLATFKDRGEGVDVRLTPDGRLGAAATNAAMSLLHLPSGPQVRLDGCDRVVALSPAGRWAAAKQGEHGLLVVDVERPARRVALSLRGLDDAPTALAFASDSDLLVGTARGALLRLAVSGP